MKRRDESEETFEESVRRGRWEHEQPDQYSLDALEREYDLTFGTTSSPDGKKALVRQKVEATKSL